MANRKEQLPQEGTSCLAAEESLTEPMGSVCPSYSGGGNDRLILESESDSSLVTVGLRESPTPPSLRRKRSYSNERSRSGSGSGSSGENMPITRAMAKRGRGRPSSRAHSVGLENTRKEYLRLQGEETALEAEKDPKDKGKTISKTKSPNVLLPNIGIEGSQVIGEHVVKNLDIVLNVARKSRNLKGTCQREIKDAVAAIRIAIDSLVERNITEETRKMHVANSHLQTELEELKKEVALLRAENERCRSKMVSEVPLPTQRAELDVDQLSRNIMVQVGTMLNARLHAMEERLLPEKRIRPALASDQIKERLIPSSSCTIALTERSSELTSSKTKTVSEPKKRKTSKNNNSKVRSSAMQTQSHTTSSAPIAEEEPWIKVTKRRSRPQQVQTHDGKNSFKTKSKRTKKKTLRPPRSAAIVLTLQPGAESRGVSYASILREAKTVDFSDIGISSFRIKKAATGARILEIPGSDSTEKADEIAKKLEGLLNTNDVRVSRSTKCAELRITELDDSISAEEVATAIAKVGGCSEAQIKTGEIRQDYAGMFTLWVRCPVMAAKKIAESGRLLVGWVSARVKLLEPMQRLCFRCLEVGHVKARCQAEVDRSELCFRCGRPGHKANTCSAVPHCVVCENHHMSSDHKICSRICSINFSKRTRFGNTVTGTKTQTQFTSPLLPTGTPEDETVPMEAQ